MKLFPRLWGACALFLLLPAVWAQPGARIISKVQIEHIGPPAASDELIRANIRVKPGDRYTPSGVDDDVRNLYNTGFFYNIRVTATNADSGLLITYLLQGKPRLMEIKFEGNRKYSDSKLRKKLTSKVGEPLDERKLFTDSQEIQKKYQQAGYPGTEVTYSFSLQEREGKAIATFHVKESPKVRIVKVEFDGAAAFPEKVGFFEKILHPKRKGLRKVIKTRGHWMFSWLTRSDILKEDVLEEDKEKLREWYRSHGYIDFELKGEPEMIKVSPSRMILRFHLYEGRQYKVGSIKFSGNKLFTNEEIIAGMRYLHELKRLKGKLGPNGLEMDVGDIFTPSGYSKDIEAVTDFYGSKGYIDVTTATRNLTVVRIPNTDTGTMDLEFQIEEGQKSFIEKIDIRGNTKTKDKVVRRELLVSPGEPFDMVRVRVSKSRIEGLDYFSKVDARPEPTDPPITGRKNLVIGVDEKSTGTLTLGAGFSSVDSLVGFVELYQGNFDIFNPPTFTGGGQKFRLHVALGTERQDYVASFTEPWLFGRKLALDIEAYHRELSYQSLESIYDETRTGVRFTLTKSLWTDFLKGSISYNVEDVGISLNSGFHGPLYTTEPRKGVATTTPDASAGLPFGTPTSPNPQTTGVGGPSQTALVSPANVPNAILEQVGHHLLSKFGATLAYDTRGGGPLPNKGQRTELYGEVASDNIGSDLSYYRLELRSAWYFKGFAPGHVIEVVGHTGVAEGLESADVPFYERYYLGGLYTLRGFRYRSISPREPGFSEPIGGDTYWFGSAEYSIPIFEQDREGGRPGVGVRFAFFYDVGSVEKDPYDFSASNFNDNWGFGLRLNLPIGPLRLDYGIPINHDQFNSGTGRFQFGVGYRREF